MASSLAFKRLVSSNLLPSYFSALRPSVAASQSAASRLFNTNASRYSSESEDEEERGVDAVRRSDPSYFRRSSPDVIDVFGTNPFLNVFFDSPLTRAGGIGSGLRQGWAAKETDDGLHLRMDMPGLGKEQVKVSVEQNTVVVKGEGKVEEEEDERKFASRIDLPEKLYKLDQIKAEMKNGVLKVVVPKVKEEERSDVFHVNVE